MDSGASPPADVRRAVAADADGIAKLVDRAYRPYVEEHGFVPGPMEADYDEAVRDKEVWVHPSDGAIRAVIVIELEKDHLWVDNVAVDPELQGEGVGTKLLALAEQRAAEVGLPELRLLTHELMARNRQMYVRLGWEDVGLRAHGEHRLAHFRKPLARAPG